MVFLLASKHEEVYELLTVIRNASVQYVTLLVEIFVLYSQERVYHLLKNFTVDVSIRR